VRETLARDITGYAIVSVYARFFEECGFAEEGRGRSTAPGRAGDRAGAVKEISERVLEGLGAVGLGEACRAQMAAFARTGATPVVTPVRGARPGRACVRSCAPSGRSRHEARSPSSITARHPSPRRSICSIATATTGASWRRPEPGARLNLRLAVPRAVIDINRIPDLDAIRVTGEGLVIGALARQEALERSPLVREHAPLIASALPHVGHSAIRARGTIGGSPRAGRPRGRAARLRGGAGRDESASAAAAERGISPPTTSSAGSTRPRSPG